VRILEENNFRDKVRNLDSCVVCGRKFYDGSGNYCSYQCETIARVSKKKFYNKKDLR
jgi:predicted nucleic acid-binding Zn ribbon protein